MMQQLRAYTERAIASATRVADAALALGDDVLKGRWATTGTTGMNLGFTNTPVMAAAWNAKPSVHATAICTHGKGYERRLQEMLT